VEIPDSEAEGFFRRGCGAYVRFSKSNWGQALGLLAMSALPTVLFAVGRSTPIEREEFIGVSVVQWIWANPLRTGAAVAVWLVMLPLIHRFLEKHSIPQGQISGRQLGQLIHFLHNLSEQKLQRATSRRRSRLSSDSEQ
jgi:hypothetical protein